MHAVFKINSLTGWMIDQFPNKMIVNIINLIAIISMQTDFVTSIKLVRPILNS